MYYNIIHVFISKFSEFKNTPATRTKSFPTSKGH